MTRRRENETEPKGQMDTELLEWKPDRQIMPAFDDDDKGFYKSEGSTELRIDRFADFVRDGTKRYSAPVYIRGLSWKIQAFSVEAKSNSHNAQSLSKVLSMYLHCDEDYASQECETNQERECETKYALRVMAQKEAVRDIVRNEIDIFIGSTAWGFPNFASCDMLLDPGEGFIKEDAVVLQAYVKPLNVKVISGMYSIKNDRLFSSSTQYPWDFVFVVQSKKVHVLKSFLAMHSEYFKEQFNKHERNNSAILLDVDYNDFIELLGVIYPTPCLITADNVGAISKLAFKFRMAALLRQCEVFLTQHYKEFGRAKALLIAEWYGLVDLTGKIVDKSEDITAVKEMKQEYNMLSLRTKRMLLDKICSSIPVFNPVSDPGGMEITSDRASEILKDLASSVCSDPDGSLIVESNRIPIHKTYLAVCSSYFKALFQGEFEERNKEEIVLEEVSFYEILEILAIIYPTKSTVTEKNVGVILKMADRFIMPGILARCRKLLQKSTQINAARKLWFAQRYNFPDLQAELAQKCKRISDVEILRAEPEYGLLDDKTRALILDSITS